MEYSEIRQRIRIMKKYGFQKRKGEPFYRKDYDFLGLTKSFMVSAEEVKYHLYLEDFLKYKQNEAMGDMKYHMKGRRSRFM